MVMIVLSKGYNSFIFDEIWNSAQIEGPEFNGDKFFRDSWSLQYWHLSSFGPQFWTKNGKSFNLDEILLFTQTEGGKLNGDNSFLWFMKAVNIGTCYLLGHSFRPKTANALVMMKFCLLHKTRVVNSMVSILRYASGCHRELRLGIEKQILCQKYYCYIINNAGKKLWLTSVKLFS